MEHNDELYLKQTVGNKNPFRVPEGYFEQLTEQVMRQLPDREPVAVQQPIGQSDARIAGRTQASRAKTIQMRPWLYAAACTALVLVMGMTYYFRQAPATSVESAPMAAASAIAPDNSYIDDAADYAMLDNAEIYAYLSENY